MATIKIRRRVRVLFSDDDSKHHDPPLCASCFESRVLFFYADYGAEMFVSTSTLLNSEWPSLKNRVLSECVYDYLNDARGDRAGRSTPYLSESPPADLTSHRSHSAEERFLILFSVITRFELRRHIAGDILLQPCQISHCLQVVKRRYRQWPIRQGMMALWFDTRAGRLWKTTSAKPALLR